MAASDARKVAQNRENSENAELASDIGTLAVKVRYFAGARAAAGIDEETVRLARPCGAPVTASDVIEAVLSRHDDRLRTVVKACSFLLNGVALRDRGVEVADGAELDVLPPFAGG